MPIYYFIAVQRMLLSAKQNAFFLVLGYLGNLFNWVCVEDQIRTKRVMSSSLYFIQASMESEEYHSCTRGTLFLAGYVGQKFWVMLFGDQDQYLAHNLK